MLATIVFKLLWILCPVLVYLLFLNEKYTKAIKVLFVASSLCVLLFSFPLFFGFSYKYDVFELFGFVAIYLLVLIAFFCGLKRIDSKGKRVRKAFKILFFYPLIIVYALITGAILFAGHASGEEPFRREEYTIAREMEWVDNTKEYAAIVIYKDVKYLPFLYYEIYENKDYNTYIERVSYNKEHNTMILILYNGSEINKRSWKVVVDLNTGLEIR